MMELDQIALQTRLPLFAGRLGRARVGLTLEALDGDGYDFDDAVVMVVMKHSSSRRRCVGS